LNEVAPPRQLNRSTASFDSQMAIVGRGKETYLWLTGIRPKSLVRLGPHVELLPADTKLAPEHLTGMVKSHFEYAVALLVVPLIRSQLRIMADNPKQLAIIAWNSQWDCLLLGALFDTIVLWNLQSEIGADEIGPNDSLNITNVHLSGVNRESHYILTDEDETWLANHFETARQLLNTPAFQTAVHSLASFHWHSHPRAQLALIWSGIESIFGVESELVFRVSLYAARFLAPDVQSERSEIFGKVKKLYKQRSAAVHGSDMKGDWNNAVRESSDLLRCLVRRCAETNGLPVLETLAP
jgi:hypothetical protein